MIILLSSSTSFGQDLNPADEALWLHKQRLFENARQILNTNLNRGDIDALHYKLEFEIQFSPNLLIGKVTGRYRSTIDNLQKIAGKDRKSVV